MTPSTEVTERAPLGPLAAFTNLTNAQVELIKRQIAVGASEDELSLFLQIAKDLDLNPFRGEIWCIKRLNKDGSPKTKANGQEYPAQITVGRDGFLTIAERSAAYSGLVSGVVKAGDTFEFGLEKPAHVFGTSYVRMKRNQAGELVEHDSAQGRGPIVGAYAYVYRRDREYPYRIFAEWSEHGARETRDPETGERKTGFSPWIQHPSLMIKKVAEANALKLAFRVNGVVAEGGEMPVFDQEGDVVDAEVVEDPARPDDTPSAADSAGPTDDESAAAGAAAGETESDPDGASSPGASEPGEQEPLEGVAE